jgi:hypothetical protein
VHRMPSLVLRPSSMWDVRASCAWPAPCACAPATPGRRDGKPELLHDACHLE